MLLNLVKAFLAVAVVVGVAVVTLPRFFGPTVDGGDAVKAYLEAHRRGDVDAEARLTCRSEMFPPLYLPRLERFSVDKVTTMPGGKEAVVVFTTTQPSRTSTHEGRIVRESGEWKWCGIR